MRRLHALPVPPTRFVGRAATIGAVRAALGSHRLVTLLGPGGSGKTRLALEVAAGHAGELRWVELAEARDAADLVTRVARALGVPLIGDDPEGLLAARLDARGPMLLALDNVEQLADAASRHLATWLRAAPEARFLVTSRHRLDIAGEAVIEVPPLELPHLRAPQRAAEAVELFVDRARAVRADFALADEQLPALARLLASLDGLPLAIELAAARVDVLGLDGLAERLRDPLAGLGRGPRDAPDRHATMRAAIAWSWGLLEEADRAALAALAVFRGGFTREAAEAVLGDGALERIERLRDRSLVALRGPTARRRFELLAVIAAFVGAEPGAAPAAIAEARARHARYFAGLAAVSSRAPVASRAALADEADNLAAALEAMLTGEAGGEGAGEAEAILDVASALERALGASAGARSALERALTATIAHRGVRRVEALRARARAERHAGELDRAADTLGEAERDAAALGARALVGAVLVDRGVLHHQRREVAEAEGCYRAALDHHTGDGAGTGRALGNLGALAHDLGRWDEARRLYGDALAALARAGDVAQEGRFHANLAVLELEVGRSAEARASFERATAALEAVGDRRLLAITRGNLGLLDHQDGRVDLARKNHEAALALLEEVGDPRSVALAAARLAGVEALAGDVEVARARIADAELRASRLGDPVTAGVVSLSRGFVDVAEAHRSWTRGHVDQAKDHVERARARVAEARDKPAEAPLLARSDDARTVARLLEHAIGSAVPSRDPPRERELRVAPAALGFAPPGGAWQDFRRRQPLRRLLLELVEHRRRAPGRSLSAERLIEAAWPGERIQADAAANRLYVALATLRKLGLKEVVLSRDEGYLIDPDVAIVWVDGP